IVGAIGLSVIDSRRNARSNGKAGECLITTLKVIDRRDHTGLECISSPGVYVKAVSYLTVKALTSITIVGATTAPLIFCVTDHGAKSEHDDRDQEYLSAIRHRALLK